MWFDDDGIEIDFAYKVLTVRVIKELQVFFSVHALEYGAFHRVTRRIADSDNLLVGF